MASTVPRMPSLLELPDDVMRKITGQLDFESIQRLRKTCHDLRNFLNDTQPDSKLQSIDLRIEIDQMHIFFQLGKNAIQVQQKRTIDGCTINTFKENRKITKTLKGEDFLEIALKNFENVLINQKSIMEYISVEYHYNCQSKNIVAKFSNELGSILKSKKQKLQVKSFHCTVIDQDQVLEVLPYLDPNLLKYVVITNVRGSSEKLEMLEMAGITYMKFWENLEKFTTMNFVVDAPIEDFLHLERVNVAFKVVTAEMVMAVKENFLHSSYMDFFELRFEKNEAEEKLVELFGQPLRQFDGFRDTKRKWFFIIPSSKYDAHSLYIYKNYVFFSRVLLKDVPENAPLIEFE